MVVGGLEQEVGIDVPVAFFILILISVVEWWMEALLARIPPALDTCHYSAINSGRPCRLLSSYAAARFCAALRDAHGSAAPAARGSMAKARKEEGRAHATTTTASLMALPRTYLYSVVSWLDGLEGWREGQTGGAVDMPPCRACHRPTTLAPGARLAGMAGPPQRPPVVSPSCGLFFNIITFCLLHSTFHRFSRFCAPQNAFPFLFIHR